MSKKNIQLSFFIAVTLIVSVMLFFVFKPYLWVIFIAGILAVSFYPTYEKMLNKFKGNKCLASLTTTSLIFVFIIVPLAIMSALLLKEAVDLYNILAFEGNSQKFIAQADQFVQYLSSLVPYGIAESQINIGMYVRNILDWVINNFDSIFSAIFSGLLNFILMMVSLYYFFIFGEDIKNKLVFWSPLPNEHDKEFIKTLRSSVDAVLRGRIVVFIYHGIFIGLGFVIFGIGSPVLWGFVGGMASLVPILGASIVTVPAIIFLFLSSKIGAGIGLLIWSVIVVGFGDNFVSAMLLKNKIQVHPLIILFSILGGIKVFGAIGFLVGPVVVSAFIALMKIYPFIMSYKDQQQV